MSEARPPVSSLARAPPEPEPDQTESDFRSSFKMARASASAQQGSDCIWPPKIVYVCSAPLIIAGLGVALDETGLFLEGVCS